MKKARMLNSDIKTNEAEVARALAEKDLDAGTQPGKIPNPFIGASLAAELAWPAMAMAL